MIESPLFPEPCSELWLLGTLFHPNSNKSVNIIEGDLLERIAGCPSGIASYLLQDPPQQKYQIKL